MKQWVIIVALVSSVLFWMEQESRGGGRDEAAHSNEVLQAMDRIIIPEVDFKNASIRDVVDFLVNAGRENDPAKQGVNILLHPSAEKVDTNRVSKAIMRLEQRLTTDRALRRLVERAEGILSNV